MTTTLIANFANYLDPAKAEIFFAGMVEALGPNDFRGWCRFDLINDRTVENQGINPPSGYFASTDGGGDDIPLKALDEGDSATYTMIEYLNGFSISRAMKPYFRASDLGSFVAQMGNAAGQLLQQNAYELLTDHVTVAREFGENLASTTHASNVGNLSNLGSTAFGYSGLELTHAAARLQKTPDGLLSPFVITTIVVPPAKEVDAWQILNSLLDDQAKDQANFFRARYGVFVNDYKENDVDWWALGSGRAHHLRGFMSVGPGPRMYVDQRSKNLVVDDDMQFDFGADGWRGVYSHDV